MDNDNDSLNSLRQKLNEDPHSRSQSFVIKGMNRDLSVSKASSDYAYENMNMRITSINENTLLSLVNEKGNRKIELSPDSTDSDDIDTFKEIMPLGLHVLNNNVVIFGQKKNILVVPPSPVRGEYDYIYNIYYEDNQYKLKKLFKGDLGFDKKHPIETIGYYENEQIQKVYWTDGINSPRVINIKDEDYETWNNKSFNFIQEFDGDNTVTVTVTKDMKSSGLFHSGVIQYVFTYYNKFGQETNIFHVTPMYYISFSGRGATAEESVNNSFKIEIKNYNSNFDYINIYSIQWTSLDLKQVKRVARIKTTKNRDNLLFIDNGRQGEVIDGSHLLYVGGKDIIAQTIAQKDDVLFLGNIELKRKVIEDSLKNQIKNELKKSIIADYSDEDFPMPEPEGYYPYKNQLGENSKKITTFKHLEYYRLGVQFQYKTGEWSEPIYIKDFQNNKSPYSKLVGRDNKDDSQISPKQFDESYRKTIFKCTMPDSLSTTIEDLISQGYTNIRPIIVYPTLAEREIIAQGVLNPTVFCIKNRLDNSTYAQPSWFFRPFPAPYTSNIIPPRFLEPKNLLSSIKNTETNLYQEKLDENPPSNNDKYKYSATQLLNNGSIIYQDDAHLLIDSYNPNVIEKGSLLCYEHLDNLGNYFTYKNFYSSNTNLYNISRNAEIACFNYAPSLDDILNNDSKYRNNYLIDQSIITLNSPEIEFSEDIQQMNMEDFKLRIVGIIPLTSFISDIDIASDETPYYVNYYDSNGTTHHHMEQDNVTKTKAKGFHKIKIGTNTKGNKYSSSYFGDRICCSGAFWYDGDIARTGKKEYYRRLTCYGIFPWHPKSLNAHKSCNIKTKRMSNLRTSYKTVYFKDDLNHELSTKDIQIFNNQELLYIKSNHRNHDEKYSYKGNIDQLANYTESYRLPGALVGHNLEDDSNWLNDEEQKQKGFYFGYGFAKDQQSYVLSFPSIDYWGDKGYPWITMPVEIKYKSVPHAIISLKNIYRLNLDQGIDAKGDYTQRLPALATNIDYDSSFKYYGDNRYTPWDNYYWDKSIGSYRKLIKCEDYFDNNQEQNGNNLDELSRYGYLWMGEIYRVISNDERFGGNTDDIINNNDWQIAGDSVSLNSFKNQTNLTPIIWSEGDTYYQRYDCVKTYPMSDEDINQNTEILSFMVETHINIDGRTDRNRGNKTNFSSNPEVNFNMMNNVYSQSPNYFIYHGLDKKFDIDKFSNQITWTKKKQIGQDIDNWTNITLASILDLKGDKGKIKKLKLYNDHLIAFQDNAISEILYNKNTQIATKEGLPIEIAKSQKVDGYNYISDTVGCQNKWSITESDNGLYFIDDDSKGIYMLNLSQGYNLQNISEKYGFSSWINEKADSMHIWDPESFKNCITYFDKINKDILFIYKKECLAFSEKINLFTSFYNYEKVPYMFNMNNKNFMFKEVTTLDGYSLWEQHAGEYNYFFGEYKPYYTEIIVNKDVYYDKIFNIVNFQSDVFSGDIYKFEEKPFDHLEVWNEYQRGIYDYDTSPEKLKRKFRIWRLLIPRDQENNRDRIRNPWIYLKLSKEKANEYKNILHIINVDYFI